MPPSRFGYVGIATGNRYFQTGDGRALPLNGEDVAWPTSRSTYDYDNWFASMQNAGENFARIWMSPWSFGIEDAPGTLNNYALQPAWRLDYVFQLAEQDGLYIQLCLDYHGMLVTQPDYWGGNNYWSSNPYDITNGGPCISPNAFFTNSSAMKIYQKRLRYLVGRYGYSQNLLSWEFWNEIDGDFSFVNSNNVVSWHGLMGGWMQTNDPYQHLLTTSFGTPGACPAMWRLPQISYAQEHSYNASSPATSLASDAQNFIQNYSKPFLIGEFGTSWQGWDYANTDPYNRGFRQGIWGGALGGSAGTAVSWWWQNVDGENLYYVYSSLGKILNSTGWGTGQWMNIVFRGASPNGIGLRGANQSLIYLVAADAAWPTGATNVSLPLQHGLTVTLTNWATGTYYAQWYDPVTATNYGIFSQGVTTNGSIKLALPDFTIDLAGIIFQAPTLTAVAESTNGAFQFQLKSESGGRYKIEESTDFVNWTSLLNVTNVQGTLLVTIPALDTNSAAFYRAKHN